MARKTTDIAHTRLPVGLSLYDSRGGLLGDATWRMAATWKRSVRAIGGCWIGEADYEGSPDELVDLFQNGMQYEIREVAGGRVTWEGFLADMTLTLHGIRYSRSWAGVANRVKAAYSRVGLNLITNPGCESAVWGAYNTPPVREQSAAWASEGRYSAHVTANAANDGVVIQSSMTATAKRAYQGRLTVKIVSGTWRLEVYNATTGVSLDYSDQDDTSETVMYVGILEDALSANTSVGLRLYCTDASGEIYADAAVFQEAPARAETSWYNDAVSQAEYGIMEHVLLLAGETDTIAAAKAQRYLKQAAYARTRPPDRASLEKNRTKLELTFCGFVFTLRNLMTALGGTEAACGTLIRSSVAASQYISIGNVQANSMTYRVEEREGYRAWNVIRDITEAGDASYNRWTCGVVPGRRFNYARADTSPVARVRGGRVLGIDGGYLEGWLAEPGYVALDDLPPALDAPTVMSEDLARLGWFDEVTWSLGDYLEDGSGVTYRTGGLE